MNFDSIFQKEYNQIKMGAKKLERHFAEVLKQHQEDIRPYLQYVMEAFKQKQQITYLEIGLCCGGSFVLTGNILSQVDIKVNAIGLDLPKTPLWGGSSIDLSVGIKTLNPLFKYKIILGNSHRQKIQTKVIQALNGNQVDLLMIDGDHSYHGCLHDFELYAPLVKPGGIIAFHDIVKYKKWKHVEVWLVWDRLSKQYKNHEFISADNYGIGIIEWDGIYRKISEFR
jgi:cephalosporin hydroxylase